MRSIGLLAIALAVTVASIDSAAVATEYQNEPFNPRVQTLPPNFTGADLSAVYAALKQRVAPKKDEYETSDTFNKRVQESAKQGVLGSLLIISIYAFSNEISPKSSRYDADRGILDFQPFFRLTGSNQQQRSVAVNHLRMEVALG
jgi:hypothetical protein